MVVDDHELVQWCLSRGADPNISSASGKSAMGRAADYASLKTLKFLFDEAGALAQKGALVADASLSHIDGSPGRLEVVRFLVDQGAPVDGFYMDARPESDYSCEWMVLGGQNALHFTVWGGKKDLVELLLDKGADKTIPACSIVKTDGQLLFAVDLAKEYGHEDIARLLETQEAIFCTIRYSMSG
ncbi:hypothetical protein PG994_008130 [Apiospora phragmitis]|uniref:Peptidase A2 domain-containing protein n=1 Tax=Apiospora phragmitis TaxID=2905665 RepID=A0ABR1US61_9PEZI